MGDVLLLKSVGLSAFKVPAVAADTEGRLPLGCAFGDLGCLFLAERGSAFPAVASAFWVLVGSTLAASLTLLGSFDSDFVVGSGVFTGDLISVRGWSTEDTWLKARPAAAAVEGSAMEGWPLVLRAPGWVLMEAAGAFKGGAGAFKGKATGGWPAGVRAGSAGSMLLGSSWAKDARQVACNITEIKLILCPLHFFQNLAEMVVVKLRLYLLDISIPCLLRCFRSVCRISRTKERLHPTVRRFVAVWVFSVDSQRESFSVNLQFKSKNLRYMFWSAECWPANCPKYCCMNWKSARTTVVPPRLPKIMLYCLMFPSWTLTTSLWWWEKKSVWKKLTCAALVASARMVCHRYYYLWAFFLFIVIISNSIIIITVTASAMAFESLAKNPVLNQYPWKRQMTYLLDLEPCTS